ncbi:MAG: sodium:calcium antiporter [Thermodesulfobacteriota bacterium]
MLISFLKFLACAAAIFYCGMLLSKYGDVIAEKTGLGRAWIGLVLMATITSLPELINGISSVTVANVPDIALGDIMGSLISNILIIAVLDLFYRKNHPIFSLAGGGHVISASYGIILIGIVSGSILAGKAMPSFGGIGLYTPLIAVVYLLGIRSVYSYEKKNFVATPERYADVTLKKAVLKFSFNAAVIVVAATLLPFIADKLAEETGLGRSFVGTFFVGLATSFPELAVSIGALRMGAIDMLIGNIFGSNMFDILIIAIDDVFYTKGPLLNDVSINHAITGFVAIIMTAVSIAALACGTKRRTFLRLGWDAIALLTVYAASVVLLYSLR